MNKNGGGKLLNADRLRQKAEEALKERQSQLNSEHSESEMLRLVRELEVHQIELEMQNDELLLAKERAELATAKYEELYEFAPSGYFVLSREGKIIQVNLAGYQIFGIERSQLKNHTFGFFVSSDSKPVFNLFLSRVFSSNTKETCDLSLTSPDTRHIHITGYAEQDKDECFVTVVDITEQKRVEKKLILANEELAFQNEEKTKRAAELVLTYKELLLSNDENAELTVELLLANKELIFQNDEKSLRAEELILANIELLIQNQEKAQRAAELFVANKELLFQNDEKAKRAEELVLANIELLFQRDEKAKRAAELVIANKELLLSNDENAKLAVELILTNKELLFQNDEKSQRAEDLILANIELLIQNQEKEKRAAELVVANELISSQRDRLMEIASLVPGLVYQFRMHPDGTFCFPYTSEAIRQIYRVAPEEVLEDASKVFLNMHPDDLQGVMISIRESAKNLSLWQHEYSVKFEDGTVRSHYGNALPRAEADGSVLWHGFITDITDKKGIEHQLEERLKELKILYALSQLASEEDITLDPLYQQLVDLLTGGFQYPEITCARIIVDGVEFCTQNFNDSAWKLSAPILSNESVIGLIEIAYLEQRQEADEGPFHKEERKLIDTLALQLKQIIKRKKGEQEIVSQLALINSLLDSIPDMIFFKDTEGVYLGCNPQFSTFVGKSRNEIVGKTDHDLFEKAIADSFRQYDREMLMKKLLRHNEEWITYPDGKKVLLDTLKTPYWGGDGSLIGILGISRDITERNSAEEELKQVSTRLTLATRSGGVVVWDYDLVNNILLWDEQMYSLYGIRKVDFSCVYEAWLAGLHPDDVERIDAEIQMAIRGEKEFDTEFRVVWPDGSIHTIRALATVQKDNFGKPVRIIGTNWDITAQKQKEQEIKLKNQELEKVNAERDKFFSIIAHDLRGPLSGFMGLTEMMADESTEFTETDKKAMTLDLGRSARNTFDLLENLLEWSQMDRGLTEFKPQRLDLMALVTECRNIVAESARKKMIELLVIIPNQTEVFADKNMVLTVIRNLLSNAIKFTPSGGEVSISAKPAENNRVLISVKDTGIGMSDQMRDNLFSVGANTMRQGTEGEKSTGLGLLLCKEFVQKNGGEIMVESEKNHGTLFSFTIPSAGQRGNEIGGAKVELTEKVAGKISNIKILIAEDDEISAKLLHVMVNGFSEEVFQVKTGNDAVEICRNNTDIDLVMMDIAMPGMNGFEATRQIRQFNQEVVIIAQTTFVLRGDREKAFEAGCNDYIAKPFGKDALIELIKKHIK